MYDCGYTDSNLRTVIEEIEDRSVVENVNTPDGF
jgi:hypothetical protein